MKPRGTSRNISVADPASGGVWLRDSCAGGSVFTLGSAGWIFFCEFVSLLLSWVSLEPAEPPARAARSLTAQRGHKRPPVFGNSPG